MRGLTEIIQMNEKAVQKERKRSNKCPVCGADYNPITGVCSWLEPVLDPKYKAEAED